MKKTGGKYPLFSDGSGGFNQPWKEVSGLDPDALNFITSVLSSGGTLTGANEQTIGDFYTGLKSDGIYDLIDRMYPFLGGNSSSNAIEMKSPGVNDLVFNGGWTHDSTGSTSILNDTCFADTGFNVGTTGFSNITNDFSFGQIKDKITAQFGYSGVGPNFCVIGLDNVNTDNYYPTNTNKILNFFTYGNFYLNSVWRTGNNWRTGYKLQGAPISTGILMSATSSSTYTRNTGTITITLNRINGSGFPEQGKWYFSWIGKYMDETQRNNFLTRINDLLNGFNRNVFT